MEKSNTQTMKILHLSDDYRPIGGAEIYMLNLSKELIEWGHDSRIFSLGNSNINDCNLRVLRESKFKLLRLLYRFTINPFLYFRLRRYLHLFNPNVIHFHNIDNKSVLTFWLACRNQNIVQSTHDYGLICLTGWGSIKKDFSPCSGFYGYKCFKNKCFPLSWLLFFYPNAKLRDRMIKNHAKILIAPSQRLKLLLNKNGFLSVIHLPYFVKDSFLSKEKNKFNKERNILYVGRISPEKGISYLLGAFSKLITEDVSLKLQIIGDGPERKNLIKKVADLGIFDKVEFILKVDQDELIKYYSRAQMLVVPSVWSEQFGMVGIEALSCGTPCVASNVGGIPEWCIDGKTGFLVPPRNVEQLYSRMKKLLNDPALVKRMGQCGQKMVAKQYTLTAHVDKLVKIYADESSKRLLRK